MRLFPNEDGFFLVAVSVSMLPEFDTDSIRLEEYRRNINDAFALQIDG